jgi:hypothetical protein
VADSATTQRLLDESNGRDQAGRLSIPMVNAAARMYTPKLR